MISGTDVMVQLLNDPKIGSTPTPVVEVLRPLVEYLPELLVDDLGKPLTLDSLMAAKLRFLRYAMEQEYVKKAVEAMPEESLGFFSREDMASMMQNMMEQLIPMMKGLANAVDMQKLLDANGITEEQVMLGPKVGLDHEVLALYRQGKARIEDVLRLQPGLIVNNTD